MKKVISLFTAMSIALGITASVTVSAQNDENLYALYTFNETMSGESRTTAADRSGNNHTATLHGNAKYEADAERGSKALYTIGLSGTYMEFPLPTDDNGNVLETFTVSMDMKNLTNGNYFNFYVGDGSSGGTGKNYFGYKMASDILLSAMTSTEKKTTLTGKGKQGEWTHVDFVLNNGTGTIYVDGASAGSLTGYTMSAIGAKVARLSFSAWSADAYAKCYYDNVAVYSKAFTAAELNELPEIDDPEDNYDEKESGEQFKITSQKGVDIQQNMIGLFFEDINYAADGGLYAEMIENRSFESRKYISDSNTSYDGLYSWSVYPSTGSGASVTTSSSGGLNTNNPNYAVFTASDTQKGLKNNAYDGVLMEKGKKYNVSLYAKSADYTGGISVSVYKDGEKVAGANVTNAVTGEWKKYSVQMTADKTARCADFVVELDGAGEVSLDMVSCMPDDAVEGIFRKDLAEKLKAINPGFLRFPGGCIIEGYNLANRYNWKDTLGDISERKQNWSRWAAHTNDGLDGGYKHYNQTYGLGFYEYFKLCEYLDCEPVPVVNVGMACQYQSKEVVDVNSDAFQQYIQDALDLIEFANGTDTSNEWVQKRISMGHTEPFNLHIIGIGNEQWQENGNNWFTRYEEFEKAIHEKYPNIKLVATSGPGVQDDNYNAAWSWIREKAASNSNFAYVVDEHYYREPDWFYSNMNFYDNYPRDVKVFAGEYASRQRNRSNDPASNSWEAALSEAAYLTMVERNADVVYMASYAPLFARINYTQWSPDMIWFDDANSYGSPTYYVQKLYSNNLGDYTLKSTLKDYGFETGVYSSASYDTETGDIIVKIVNSNASEKTIPIELDENFDINGTASVEQIASFPVTLWNTIADPETVYPKKNAIYDFTYNYDYTVPRSSFTVLRIGTTDEKHKPFPDEFQYLTEREPLTDTYQAMVYTTGTDAAGGSIHIAISGDGGETFEDVNHGFGAITAPSENGSARALRSPSVFKMDDGKYGIVAIRTDPAQDAAADCDNRDGSFILYTTTDFEHFTNEGFKTIGIKRLKDISCNRLDDGTYNISWRDEKAGDKSERYSVTTTDFESFSEPINRNVYDREYVSGISGAISSSAVGITKEMYDALKASSEETKYNEYGVDLNHVNGRILPDSCSAVFDASKISGTYNDYDISKDGNGILSGWSSTWNVSKDETITSKQMNCNFITVGGKQYFQFYGPDKTDPVSLYTPGYAADADWFAVEFTLNSSATVGCHDSILLDNDKKPFFGYAYAKYNDGFFPGDGERHYNDDGTGNDGTSGGDLGNFLGEAGGASCTYTNGQTVVRIIVDNGAKYNDTDAYAVTTAYSNDGVNFTPINTRYYSGSVNGFGGITVGALANSTNWYDNTRYGNMKVYVPKNDDNPASYTINDVTYETNVIKADISGEAGIISVIAAAYDSDGKLIKTALKETNFPGGTSAVTIPDFDADTAAGISVFVWNSISDMKPLGECFKKEL